MKAEQIIIEPILSEKTNLMRESSVKKYVFKVHPSANKLQIMDAVNKLFSVKPSSCNIVNVKGKKKMVATKSGHRKGVGSTPSWKKAIISMNGSDTIEVFEGV